MISWMLRKIQGPSFGQTRRSPLQELIDDFEAQRTDEMMPHSRKQAVRAHEKVTALREGSHPQNYQDSWSFD